MNSAKLTLFIVAVIEIFHFGAGKCGKGFDAVDFLYFSSQMNVCGCVKF